VAYHPTQPGIFVIRLRVPDGYQVRPHWHTRDEYVTVISGRLGAGMGERLDAAQIRELPVGGYVSMPGGHRHYVVARGETVLQITGPGPFDIHYINPGDDPRLQRSSR